MGNSLRKQLYTDKSKINCNRYNSSHSHRTANCFHVMHTSWNLNKQIVSWKWIPLTILMMGKRQFLLSAGKFMIFTPPLALMFFQQQEDFPVWCLPHSQMRTYFGIATCLKEISSASYPNQFRLDAARHVRWGWDTMRWEDASPVFRGKHHQNQIHIKKWIKI